MNKINIIWFGLQLEVPAPEDYPSMCVAVDGDNEVYAYEFPPHWNFEFKSWVATNGMVWCLGSACLPDDFSHRASIVSVRDAMQICVDKMIDDA